MSKMSKATFDNQQYNNFGTEQEDREDKCAFKWGQEKGGKSRITCKTI